MSSITAGTTSTTTLIHSGDTTGSLVFKTNDTGSGGTTAVTIDTSQNVGIGTTTIATIDSTGKTLEIYGGAGGGFVHMTNSTTGQTVSDGFIIGTSIGGSDALLVQRESANMIFRTADTERMRIDSSGNLLVGKTSTAAGVGEKFGLTTSTDNAAIYITPTNASYSSTIVYINTTRAASAGFDFYGGYANSVGQFRVTGSGTIFAQNTSVQSISDKRLKENIQDATDGLEVITALRPVRYDWKTGYGNDRKNQLGFIAQEVEAVFPEAVSEWQVNKEDETAYKTVGPSAFIPVLVKAIQELKAINDQQAETINALTARVVALEGQ